MTDPVPGAARRPYAPFPPFASWAEVQFDLALVDRFGKLLEDTRSGADEQTLAQALDRVTKWAAIDTGAIEGLYDVERGFTFSVAAAAAAWDNIHLVKGERVKRAINDALNGYECVLDLVTGSAPVTEVWIKQLHAVLCASQDTYEVVTAAGPQSHALPHGEYKRYPNNPFNIASATVHEFAPVTDTPAEMARLVAELRSPEYASAHPVLQAAYAHYAFVCVHPFADGNGRVARALASVYLYRSPGVPLVIFADQKTDYLNALEAADDGDPEPFVKFVAERVVDTVQMMRTDVRSMSGPSIEDRLGELQQSLLGRGGLRHDEVDALGVRLLDALQDAFARRQTEHVLPAPLSVQVGRSGPVPPPEGFRAVPNATAINVTVRSSPPAGGTVTRHYGVAVAGPDQEPPDFVLISREGAVLMDVFLREVTPAISTALSYRLDAIAESETAAMVDLVIAQGQEALRNARYNA